MRKLLVLAVLLAAVGQAAASAAPTPTASITACVVGGSTVVQWDHAKVTGVTFVWSGAEQFLPASSPISVKPPHGSLTIGTAVGQSTGAGPTSVTATLTLAGGGSVQATGSCG